MSNIRRILDTRLSNLKKKQKIGSGKAYVLPPEKHWFVLHIVISAKQKLNDYFEDLKSREYISDFCFAIDFAKSIYLDNNKVSEDIFKTLNYVFIKMCISGKNRYRVLSNKYVLKFFPNNVEPYYIDNIENFIRSINNTKVDDTDNIDHKKEEKFKIGSVVLIKNGIFVDSTGYISTVNYNDNIAEVYILSGGVFSGLSNNVKTSISLDDIEIVVNNAK